MNKQLAIFEQSLESKRALRSHLMQLQRATTKKIIDLSNEIMSTEREMRYAKARLTKW